MSVANEVRNRLIPFRRFFPLGASAELTSIFRQYLWALPLIALLGLLASVLEGIGIGLLIPLVSFLLADAIPSGVPEPIVALAGLAPDVDQQTRIMAFGGAMAAFILFKGLVQAANNIFISHLDGRMGQDLRSALAGKLLQLDYPFFLRHDSARLVHILSVDTGYVVDAARLWLSLIPAIAALLVTSALLLWLSPTLFVVAVAGAILVQLVLIVMVRRQAELSSAVTANDLVLWNRILALVQNVRVIRAFGQRDRERNRFEDGADGFRKATLDVQRLGSIVGPTVDALMAIMFIAVLLASYQSGISVATTTAFLVLLVRAQPYAQVLSRSRVGIAAAYRAQLEVEWLLQQQPVLRRPDAADRCEAIDQPIHFERVGFTYPNGNCALESVSFSVKPGRSTALIGRSGSGKSTILNLLLRLLEPQEGSIKLGDRPIVSYDLDSWRSRIAIAGQDIELVDGTVVQNIAYGRPDASIEEIVDVARTAGALEFIERLPDGFATEVGAEGIRLSGGQRQRISLARALLRRPDLLVLDEAMNAVDAISETEIMTLLREHRHFRTALIVSHRKSTLAACQDGIVIDEGCIREAGPLASLTYFRDMAGREARGD